MKLALYLMGRVGGTTLAAGVLLLGLVFTFEVIDEAGNAGGNYGFGEAVYYAFLKIPTSLVENVPLMGLLGALLGLGTLASTSELVAMRAAGVSLRRLVAWACVPGVLLGLFALSMAEWVVPKTDLYAERYKGTQSGSTSGAVTQVWQKAGETFFNAQRVDGPVIEGLFVYRFDGVGLAESIAAEQATFGPEGWQAESVERMVQSGNTLLGSRQSSEALSLARTPEELALARLDPTTLPPSLLWASVQNNQREGLSTQAEELALYKLLLLPALVVCLVLAGVGFVFGPLRSSPIGTRLFVGVLVGLGFKLAQDVSGPAAWVYGADPLFAVLVPGLLAVVLGLANLSRS